ncbi:MAG: hypothetical protein AAF217_10475 [Pseudomonadota bacterium]
MVLDFLFSRNKPRKTSFLLIDEDPELGVLLECYLKAALGNQFKLVHVSKVTQALEKAASDRFDYFLLDVSLAIEPGVHEIHNLLKSTQKRAILLLLSASGEEPKKSVPNDVPIIDKLKIRKLISCGLFADAS